MNDRHLIAVSVDEMGQLWHGHFGMAPFYHIYDHTGTLRATRRNPYSAGPGTHTHHDNPQLIVELLPECRVFLARRMGTHGRQRLVAEFGIVAVLTTAEELEPAIRDYLTAVGSDSEGDNA